MKINVYWHYCISVKNHIYNTESTIEKNGRIEEYTKCNSFMREMTTLPLYYFKFPLVIKNK